LSDSSTPKDIGFPSVKLLGKVTSKAIGRNNPGFAFDTAIFTAANTTIWEALAEIINNPILSTINPLKLLPGIRSLWVLL
jgi:hypothetical protein